MSSTIEKIDWPSLMNGTSLQMKDFPSVRLLKLDNAKGVYYGYGENSVVVDIKEYNSESHGNYYYFQTCKDDWHPLTTRLWDM